ncbi:MAG TPA: tetratricopeptide repeat protein, partial [Acidisphaera sp.]|nr:tetratricopeptide repeat protein [Acidisphaera sp.]
MLDDVRPHPALQDGDPFRPSGPDPALLIRRAGELLDAGRLGAVRPLLAALERLGAPAGELALLQARLAVQENRLDDARTALDAAVDAAPDDPVLRKARADVRFRLKLFTGAAQDAAEAVILDSRDPQAKAQLGAMLLALGRAADALRCLAEAVAASPLNPAYRESLAAAEEMNGDPEAAIATLEAGTALMPRAVSLRRALMRIWLRLGNAESAAAVAAAARREGVVDSGLLALTAQALIMLDLEDAAIEAFAE